MDRRNIISVDILKLVLSFLSQNLCRKDHNTHITISQKLKSASIFPVLSQKLAATQYETSKNSYIKQSCVDVYFL